MIDVRIQAADFDAGRQLARLAELGKAAIASLVLLAEAEEDVTEIVVEHYPAMAKAELGRIAAEADSRWELDGIILMHRHGRIVPGDQLLLIAVASSSTRAAQEACSYLAAQARERAPFWRKEILAAGASRWA
jgi:molybdopterin synthase catalytic subunit